LIIGIVTVETHYRSLIKAVSWRTGGTIVTCLVAWYLTGSLDLATRIGIVDTAIKIGAFYLHERFWHHIGFGKVKQPEYEI
jgi:uncharacterized membrane protein